MRRVAHEYAVMVSNIQEAKNLRYLDTGEKLDPREKIQATARRVGLTVPQVGVLSDCFTFFACIKLPVLFAY